MQDENLDFVLFFTAFWSRGHFLKRCHFCLFLVFSLQIVCFDQLLGMIAFFSYTMKILISYSFLHSLGQQLKYEKLKEKYCIRRFRASLNQLKYEKQRKV